MHKTQCQFGVAEHSIHARNRKEITHVLLVASFRVVHKSVSKYTTQCQFGVAEHSIAKRETGERAILDGGWRASHTPCTSHTEIPVSDC
jgi:alkylhydroperoxidase family enzyme